MAKDTLLTTSVILLYGREMDDISINNKRAPYPVSNKLLDEQYRGTNKRFARIYALSYAGQFRELTPPTIFLVHGDGEDPQPRMDESKLPVAPHDASQSGVAGQIHNFSKDIKVWTYDKNDFSIRLDVTTGMLEDILLAPELFDEDDSLFAGGRVGGGKVGGGKVGGGKVGGGKVGGGKVGGGKVGAG